MRLRLRLPGRSGLGAPRFVLGSLVAAQFIALVAFVLAVRHNGWLFYQGGDETFFYTGSWVVSGGHIPEAAVGYAWSYLLAPVALAVGPSLLAALPAIVLLQTLVLLPLALYCVYEIAERIGGRWIGYLAAGMWVAVPFVAIPLWHSSYHAKYVEQFLPQAFGLTGLADFPSMVCLLVAALFCVRALDRSGPRDGVFAGIATGFAIGVKPANVLFLLGPLLAFGVARRAREGIGFAVALLPALLTLALWKYRGLGHLPIVTPTPHAIALGGAPGAAGGPFGGIVVDRYVDLDWSRLRENYVDLRSLLRGVLVWQSLPVLGFLAAVSRSAPKALLLLGWFAAFVLVKGTSDEASIDGGTLLRLFMPGFPPLLILSALAPLLVPGVRAGPRRRVDPSAAPIRWRVVSPAFALFAVVPLVLVATLPPLRAHTAVKYFDENVLVPVDDLAPAVRTKAGRQVLSWRQSPSPQTRIFYRVLRARPVALAPDPTLPSGREGIRCLGSPDGYAGASDCRLEMAVVGVTTSTVFVDKPPPGRWVYRIGVTANWRDDPSDGDVMLLSRPTAVAVERRGSG